MASIWLALTAELTPALDALDDLQRAHERLASRHGDAFRALDREIDGILEGGELVATADLEGDRSRFFIIPSPKVTEALKRARQLGVI